MASVAVFIALSAGAYAAGLAPNSVKSRHIVDNQVKPADVRDDNLRGGGLTGTDIIESSLTGVPVEANSVGSSQVVDDAITGTDIIESSLTGVPVEANSVGSSQVVDDGVGKSEIASNSIGSEELLGISEVANTQSIPANGFATVVATCPAGQQIITGGFSKAPHAGGMDVTVSRRSTTGGWEVRFFNSFSSPVNQTTYAYCLSP
jgi:hypothetical protein